jgi:NitT/TauT family transport system ATP-binding protein
MIHIRRVVKEVQRPPASGVALAATSSSVVLTDISMRFGADLEVLQAINFSLAESEFLAIVGPSGCGKSTLLKLISGLLTPTRGKVLFRNVPVTGTPPGIGFMFQRDTLLPWSTVAQNIAVGLDCRGVPKREQPMHLERLLTLLGLGQFGGFYPRALSGGMRQRVALGRLLAYEPDIYLMDEPFGALDAQTKIQMGYELMRIWGADRKGVVFVTHDIEEAVSLADRVIVLTGRPGGIKSEYFVDLPRPRDLRAVRKLKEFHSIVEGIWNDVLS